VVVDDNDRAIVGAKGVDRGQLGDAIDPRRLPIRTAGCDFAADTITDEGVAAPGWRSRGNPSAPTQSNNTMRMKLLTLTTLLAVTAAWAQSPAPAPAPAPDETLASYVGRPDPSFAWNVHARFERGGTEVVELRLTSQTWRGIEWRHRLYLIKPANADLTSGNGVVMVAGGRWRPQYADEVDRRLPRGALLYLRIAEQLESVVAIIAQVPFQPLFGHTEDELIAHSFEQYLASGDADWPLLLPMVRSVVSAIDAVQAFTASEWDLALERFTVFGGSKRGWTTWLTGAVDPRVIAIAPLVIDVLNFAEHLPHQTDVWGEPSEDISPYTRRGLDRVLSTEEGTALRAIVDPYSYRDRLTLPKLIVLGTNDSYFPLASANLYWPELEGSKYLLYLPNNQHSLRDLGRMLPTINQLHRHVTVGARMPDLAWEFLDTPAGPALCMRSDIEPRNVRVWIAESDSTDFRDARWSSRRMRSRGDTQVFTLQRQRATYAAMFGEFEYGPAERYHLTTNVRIVGPDVPGREPHSDAGVCPDRL
jgi:PhoPQ-activated pathogenicity-related protein